MKKLLSFVLIISVFISATMMSTVSTLAAEVDYAKTSERVFCVSPEDGMDFSAIDGYCYGYVGDADNDDTVSVMDATAIQLHCAQEQMMIEVLCKMADVDRDGEISVMDATAIQLHLASIKESPYINHILYTPYDNFDPLYDTFDDIATFIINSGEFDDKNYEYYLETTHELDGIEVYTHLSHQPVPEGLYDPQILIYTITYFPEYDSYSKMVTTFTRGSRYFNYYVTEYIGDITLYQMWGKATVKNPDAEAFELLYDTEVGEFSTDYDISYKDVKALIPNMSLLNLSCADHFIMYDVPATILDLVCDVQSFM